MSDRIETRVLPGKLPADYDRLARGERSPWNTAAYAAVFDAPGTRAHHLVATDAGAPAGAVTLLIAGSRRLPALDRPLGCRAIVLDEPAATSAAAARALAAAAGAAARRFGAVEAEFRLQLPRRLGGPDLEELGYRVEPEGFGVKELPPAGAGLDATLRRMARRQVKKAREAGVRVEATEDLGRLLPLLDRSFSRSGLAARDPGFVARLAEHLDAEVLVAVRRGRDLAALLWAAAGPVALNVFHGRADGEIRGASHLLHREMFARAAERGAEVVHTGGMAPAGAEDGIRRFKRSLGFESVAGARGLKILRPAVRRVRSAMLSTWLRLRSGRGTG